MIERLVIVGVGLIGGSIALAARERRVASQVIGVTRSEASRQRAEAAGVCDSVTTQLAEAVAEADLVIACTSVQTIPGLLAEVAASCPAEALLTDAGSTKAVLVEATEQALGERHRFVGSHPLAGDHRTGPEAARADLFDGRVVVVTPTDGSDATATGELTQFWQSLGAEVRQMTPNAHDAALARTSHLPHLVAAAVAAATPGGVLPLVGTGWRDHTRVAAGDAGLWREILLANREHMTAAMDELEKQLSDFRQALAAGDGDALQQLLEQGRQQRDAVGD